MHRRRPPQNVLLYDAKIEVFRDPREDLMSGEVRYKLRKSVSHFNHLTSMPCGTCPVFDVCSDGGSISPATCVYMAKWLDF